MHTRLTSRWTTTLTLLGTISLAACQDSTSGITAIDPAPLDPSTSAAIDIFAPQQSSVAAGPVFLVLDQASIDNGAEPMGFSDVDLNDDIAQLGQRRQLRYFAANVGRDITLYTGETGDEGWHAIKQIPATWQAAGPTTNGARNFLLAGPGLGTPDAFGDPESQLDKIAGVTPLRATGLAMLRGQSICAVVLKGKVDVNYLPLEGSLKGDTRGIVAFEVISVTRRRNGSTTSLPAVGIRIQDATQTCASALQLFANAPTPRSSSDPINVAPPANPPAPRFVAAP
ncbi:MAG: hypothetical protein MUF00_02445 [Gemmatimonadaceae bacterium]|nr:hypothetical protein [Gemmatimonadaceae bacterium]